jgi:hypothetical protein
MRRARGPQPNPRHEPHACTTGMPSPHSHALVPDGVWVPLDDGVRFVELPPPSQAEVERLLEVLRHRVLRMLQTRGALPGEGPEDARQAYQAQSLQQRFRWTGLDVRPPPKKVPRCAFLEGFCLHANTHLHANDRQGLERLCRYAARGALAMERFEEAEDGRIAYRMKRPMPEGTTHLLFTGLELLRRVASRVPPPRTHLTRFHGVFAPGARLRPFRVPAAAASGEEEAPSAGAATVGSCGRRQRAPRLDGAGLLRRTFAVDVFSCPRCAGPRRVLASLTQGAVIRRILRHLQLPEQPPRLAPALGPPQQALWESLSAEGRTLSRSSRQPVARARQGCAWSATCRPPWGPPSPSRACRKALLAHHLPRPSHATGLPCRLCSEARDEQRAMNNEVQRTRSYTSDDYGQAQISVEEGGAL